MGIHNLNKFLRNNCPQVYEKIHLSEYSYKKIAIDISLYLCKFKTIHGDKWLSAFIGLVSCLRKNEIHCVFIYDSGSPPEKQIEREKRANDREKTQKRVYELNEALEKFHITGEIDKLLVSLHDKIKSTSEVPRRLLHKKDDVIDMDLVEAKISKMKSSVISITKEDFLLTKELFNILKIPFIDAPLEAETTCADLCKRGMVDGALSEDTDLLAYETPIFLSKIDIYSNTCVRINYEEMLGELELKSFEFLDLCVMMGTDYNKNIFRVGPEKSYQYIKKHRTIENVGKELDISILNHLRGRELFREYERVDIAKIPYCGRPDFTSLKYFCFENNIPVDVDGLKRHFINDVIIADD